MMTKKEVLEWLETLDDDSGVAIDEGGLCLVEIDENGEETESYIEVGGIPDEEDMLDPDEEEDDIEENYDGFQTEN